MSKGGENRDWGYASYTEDGRLLPIENPDEFMEEVLNWLGVSKNDEFIDPGFEVKYTKDDLISKDIPVADAVNEVNGNNSDNNSTDNNSDSNKNILVEAGAGTGKTFYSLQFQ